MARSNVASVVEQVSYEPDPLANNQDTMLAVRATVPPGQFEGNFGGVAVLLAAENCAGDPPPVIAVYDRDGHDMGRARYLLRDEAAVG